MTTDTRSQYDRYQDAQNAIYEARVIAIYEAAGHPAHETAEMARQLLEAEREYQRAMAR